MELRLEIVGSPGVFDEPGMRENLRALAKDANTPIVVDEPRVSIGSLESLDASVTQLVVDVVSSSGWAVALGGVFRLLNSRAQGRRTEIIARVGGDEVRVTTSGDASEAIAAIRQLLDRNTPAGPNATNG